jgi:hypothetical protein
MDRVGLRVGRFAKAFVGGSFRLAGPGKPALGRGCKEGRRRVACLASPGKLALGGEKSGRGSKFLLMRGRSVP